MGEYKGKKYLIHKKKDVSIFFSIGINDGIGSVSSSSSSSRRCRSSKGTDTIGSTRRLSPFPPPFPDARVAGGDVAKSGVVY